MIFTLVSWMLFARKVKMWQAEQTCKAVTRVNVGKFVTRYVTSTAEECGD